MKYWKLWMTGMIMGLCISAGLGNSIKVKAQDRNPVQEESSICGTTSAPEPENPQHADATAPTIQWFIGEKEISDEDEIFLGADHREMIIRVSEKEENDLGIANVKVKLSNSKGNSMEKAASHEKDGCREEIIGFSAEEITSFEDGTLCCEVVAEDRVGAVREEGKAFILDTAPPQIAVNYSAPTGVDKMGQTELTYYAEKIGMNIVISEENPDLNSYFAELLYSATGEDDSFVATGKVVYWESSDSGKYEAAMVAAAGEDPDGYYKLKVTGTDRAGNTSQYESNVKILESGRVLAEIVPTTRAAAYTESGRTLYAGAVHFAVHVTDQSAVEGGVRSGIAEVTCDLLSDGEYIWKNRVLYAKEDEDETSEPEQYDGTIVVPATSRTESNQLEIIVHAIDVAGNGSEDISEDHFFFGIDTTGPRISVQLTNDDVRHGRYFRTGRMALIREEEENPARSIIIKAEGATVSEMQGEIDGASGEKHVRRCTALFEADGEYTLEVHGTDALGNPAQVVYQGVSPNSFCIDTTPPVIRVTYDENEAKNEYFFNRDRTAYVNILDQNVEPAGIQAMVNGEMVASDVLRQGETPVFSVHFGEDGVYQMIVFCEDLAGNRSEVWRGERFVIDETAPVIRFLGESHLSMADAYLCAEKAAVMLCNRTNGTRPECFVKEKSGEDPERQGFYRMTEIPHTRSGDGIYILRAKVEDLAGNEATFEDRFVVNRFGPSYRIEMDSASAEMARKGYFTGENVEILEKTLTETENRSVLLFCTNQSRRLEEGKEYTVEKLQKEGYQENRIVIGKGVFQEDGRYDLIIGGKRVFNVITDHTPPTAEIVGIDLNMHRFSAQEVTFSLIPYDNQALEKVTVRISDWWDRTLQETSLEGEELEKVLAQRGRKIPVTVSEKKGWQFLEISLEDGAGNRTDLMSRRDGTACQMLVTQEASAYYFQLFLLAGIVVTIGSVLAVGIRVYKSTLA